MKESYFITYSSWSLESFPIEEGNVPLNLLSKTDLYKKRNSISSKIIFFLIVITSALSSKYFQAILVLDRSAHYYQYF